MGSFEKPNFSRGVFFNKKMMGRLLVPPTPKLGGQAGEPGGREGEVEACSPGGREAEAAGPVVFDLLGKLKISTGACPEGLPRLALTRNSSLPSSLIKSLWGICVSPGKPKKGGLPSRGSMSLKNWLKPATAELPKSLKT